MTPPGRNAPCPCGSGKKYKKCCIDSNVLPFPGHPVITDIPDSSEQEAFFDPPPTFMESLGTPNQATEMLHQIHQIVADNPCQSIDELQSVLDRFKEQQNSAAQLDFLGLSPAQVHQMRSAYLFSQPEIVVLSFPVDAPEYKHCPGVYLAIAILIEVATNDTIKTTSKGNLPRKVVQRLFEQTREVYLDIGDRETISSEEQLPELHLTRILLELSRLIHLRENRFQLTDLGQEVMEVLLHNQSASRIYRYLLQAFSDRLNWLYIKDYPEALSELQRCASFCLYIFHARAQQYTGESVLSGYLLRAFPILAQMLQRSATTVTPNIAERLVHRAFMDLVVAHYGFYFGLLDRRVSNSHGEAEYRCSRLFKQVFTWNPLIAGNPKRK